MKIGILTFHRAHNYGAVLQTYGLQEFLKSLGHEVYVIDYCPQYVLKPYQLFRMYRYQNLSRMMKFKMLIRELLLMPVRLIRKKNFTDFLNEKLNLISFDLNNTHHDFDLFVLGSDQIWNSQITDGIDEVFWGNFPAARGKMCISYAASVGDIKNLQTLSLTKIQSYINNFFLVSVREKDLAEYFKTKFKIDVALVLDPVLLAGEHCFDSLVNDMCYPQHYLLLFQIYDNEFVRKTAFEISRKLNLRVVQILSGQESFKSKTLQTVSVGDFLGYIRNADYVVTSSFHGTAFSILFQKNFNIVSVNPSVDVRAYSLLCSLGIERKFIHKNQSYDLSKINYGILEEKYSLMRKDSELFIEKCLKQNRSKL